MRLLVFLAATTLLSCGQSSAPGKKEKGPEDNVKSTTDTVKTALSQTADSSYATPDEGTANTALQASSQGNKWHVLNDKEAKWMKDAFDYFIVPKRKTAPNYPYITKGDFNADGNPDMAAVVTDSLKANYRIAIILGPGNVKLWEEDIMIDAALSTVPPSTIEGMDGEKTKKIKLKGDGINIEYFEKASFVLYWDKSSFKRIQTGD
ncbi:MAG: hypothetical protein SGI83_12945 [Bacteroidota bacterium]|nr:hypothetical protein [Bacteroidota bacterium]